MIEETQGRSLLEFIKMNVETIKEWVSLATLIGILAILAANVKGIIDGFKGEDGKWDVAEISKLVIIGIIIYMVSKDANRTHEWRFFSNNIYYAFILGLFALAELKEIVKMIYQIFAGKKPKDDEQTDST